MESLKLFGVADPDKKRHELQCNYIIKGEERLTQTITCNSEIRQCKLCAEIVSEKKVWEDDKVAVILRGDCISSIWKDHNARELSLHDDAWLDIAVMFKSNIEQKKWSVKKRNESGEHIFVDFYIGEQNESIDDRRVPERIS